MTDELEKARDNMIDTAIHTGATTFKLLVMDFLIRRHEFDLVMEIDKIPIPHDLSEVTVVHDVSEAAAEELKAVVSEAPPKELHTNE